MILKIYVYPNDESHCFLFNNDIELMSIIVDNIDRYEYVECV